MFFKRQQKVFWAYKKNIKTKKIKKNMNCFIRKTRKQKFKICRTRATERFKQHPVAECINKVKIFFCWVWLSLWPLQQCSCTATCTINLENFIFLDFITGDFWPLWRLRQHRLYLSIMDTTSVAMKKHEKSLLTPKQNNMKHVSVKKNKKLIQEAVWSLLKVCTIKFKSINYDFCYFQAT